MKKQAFMSALTATLLSLTITALLEGTMTPVLGQSPTPKLVFEPKFHFGQELGEEFKVNVTIYNVNSSLHLVAIHFRVHYDPTMLEIVNVSEGDFLPRFNQTTHFVWATEPDGVFGPHLVVGTWIFPNATGQWSGPFPEGNGTVATIAFRVIYQPVEPEPAKACLLRFIEVILLDDQSNEISYETGIFYYQTPTPMLYPEPSFTYQPKYPVAGQAILFNASGSTDPDGKIVEYLWDFDDGTVLVTGENETVAIHTYTQPKIYNVTLTVKDDDGLVSQAWMLVEVGVYTPIDMKIEAGELYYPGEITEFYIHTSQLGRPLNVTFVSASLYFNGSLYEDLNVSLIQPVAGGLYRVLYTVPGDAKAGVYLLFTQVEYSNMTSTAIASFQISDALMNMNKTIARIDGNVAEILTQLDQLRKFDLQAINATLGRLEGTVAVINSTLGPLKTTIENINIKVIEIVDDYVAKINYTLGTVEEGTIKGEVVTIKDDVAWIKTQLGPVKTDVSNITGGVGGLTTVQYIVLILALIAAVSAVLCVIKAWKK